MMTSPPDSPCAPEAVSRQRPQSAMIRPPRSNSRMSINSKQGGSRVSDEDSKTSVRVAVRVRPPLQPTDPGYELIPQRFQRSMVQVTTPTSLAVDVPQGRKLFVFDRVFDEDTTQEGIWEYLHDSVNCFVQGYNVSILAYGQSGAGKSFTMGTSGPAEQSDPGLRGIIPRAAAHLFEKLTNTSSSQIRPPSGLKTPARYSMQSSFSSSTLNNLSRASEPNWQLKATYVEIYNEQLRDLLLPESTPAHERANVTIREDTKGRIILTGLHQIQINTIDDLLGALNFGSAIRQTDATAINAKSSRSHAVFSLNLVQKKTGYIPMSTKDKRMSAPIESLSGSEGSITTDSKLHFVDLAGSERLKNTGASGERAKEGISINAGLASLGKVIAQLSSRQAGSHVSYRDSRLTRLLQDSLGGNAITYMIACVTPAEFHLSETLNTVQYAQRARAIQSKPQIQSTTDETDKLAVIDRLKAEVAFLRQQIRNSEGGDRKIGTSSERSERQNEREMELQNSLLDVQEGYNALSQRHAKLIAELTHSGDANVDTTGAGGSSVDRLKRSQANQQQIEHMVMEYEKTIQSLESNLSTTRTSLAANESHLLEKETKHAYAETMNHQLQARIQKLVDREANNETYLRELEARLDNQSSGDQKVNAVVLELRKEVARLRESETNSEEYISTLEDRLAEADQDIELMQREVERLEHVVERQRSLGKLDTLLYELDHIQTNGQTPVEAKPLTNGVALSEQADDIEHQRAFESLRKASQTAIPEETEEELAEEAAMEQEASEEATINNEGLEEVERTVPIVKRARSIAALRDNNAQNKHVADKLDSVTQELFELRLDHESTVNEYDLLSAKYQEALRTLAELQDAVDEARHPVDDEPLSPPPTSPTKSRPQSFLGDSRINEIRAGGKYSHRSLSSELSSAGELPTTTGSIDTTRGQTDLSSENADAEIERLTKLLAEHEQGMSLVTQQYAQLQAEHHNTLNTVYELKNEIQKAKSHGSPVSPPLQHGPQHRVIRRQTSQSMVTVDRAHRSLASLRNIAIEEFDSKPDTMQTINEHLNTAMHELHSRMERIHTLEEENKSVKKEMETKTTMITGLTRERNSTKATSPIDISVFGQMQEDHASRERRLQDQLESIKSQHSAAVSEKENAEKKLFATVAELEAMTVAMETMRSQSAGEDDTAAKDMQKERGKHMGLVDSLKNGIEGHKANLAAHKARVAELEEQHALAQREVNEQKEHIKQLEREIEEHKAAIAQHKHSLQALHDAHDKELADLHFAIENAKTEHQDRLDEITAQHESNITELQGRLDAAHREQDELLDQIAYTLGRDVTREDVSEHITEVIKAKHRVEEIHSVLAGEKAELETRLNSQDGDRGDLEKQIAEHAGRIADYQERIRSLANDVANHEESLREKDALLRKRDATIQTLNADKQSNSRIIEELEQQIENSFDQHNNRLSVMQAQGSQALEEANRRVSLLEKELEDYKSRLEHITSNRPQSPGIGPDGRSNSLNSNLRKSASVASLPSPPPAIPLPPLPTIAQATNGAGASNSSASPPASRHTSKDISMAQQHQAQLIEDQEARIRTIEKHLHAEKQLTATLEEALVDLETQSNKVRADMENWKKKAWALEEELQGLRREQKNQRHSIQQFEEERDKRREAEAARAQLEQRMQALNKKKKKSGLNCF